MLRRWHPANTLCVPHCDLGIYAKDQKRAFQRMCDSCATSAGCPPPAEDSDDTANAGGDGTGAARSTAPTDDMPCDNVIEEDWTPAMEASFQEAVQGQQPKRQDLPPAPTRATLLIDDQRSIAKTMWKPVAPDVPRNGHNGLLHMPRQEAKGGTGVSVDEKTLLQFRERYPLLPFVRPAPAAVTATKLLAESDGTWNDDLRWKALQLFLADAANLIFCLVMPDVFARPRLLKDERFKGEEPGSCKLICPTCLSNKYVLVGDMNTHDTKSLRFAYGATSVVMGVGVAHHCCNPQCSAVVAARSAESIEALREYVKDGIFGNSAKNNIEKIKRLGVAFSTLDYDVMQTWPREVPTQFFVTYVLRAPSCVVCRCASCSRASCSGKMVAPCST